MPDRGEDLYKIRLEKLKKLKASGVDPFPSDYRRSHNSLEGIDLFTEEEERLGLGAKTAEVKLAGRLIAMRVMGKVAFLDIRDGAGTIQLQLTNNILGEAYSILKDLDLGDFVGSKGPIFRTRTKEITQEVREICLLAKSLKTPPEKWHGIKDIEIRYRQRYLDLMSSEDVKNIFVIRSKVIKTIRDFLDSRGFIEVESPILLPVAAGAMARPFVTHHNALNNDLYMRIATELYLKRCIIGGFDKVYELGRVFRNEGIDIKHNPEYTLLETYEAYSDYTDVMKMTEEMFSTLSNKVLGDESISWNGETIDFTKPWHRLNLRKEIQDSSGIDIEELSDSAELLQGMKKMGIQVDENSSWGRLVDKLISETVEPRLIQPTFLIDYPKAMSPLAKEKSGNSDYVERFEGFAGGMEIANAFTELNDPIEQRRRFQDQEDMRRMYGNEDFDRLDEDFLTALEYGMPPTGGLGIGLDRIVMLLSGQQSIKEVIMFPQLRTKDGEMGVG